jgi:acetoin utilization deacetylase AcuC-like enzyme
LDMVLASQPDIVFYLAGADPFEGDRLGRLKLTIAGLEARDRLVLERCRTAQLPVVVTMSGGYAHNVDDIVRIHANTIRVATSLASLAHPAASGTP